MTTPTTSKNIRVDDDSDLELPAHSLLPLLAMAAVLLALLVALLRSLAPSLAADAFDDPSGWEDMRCALQVAASGSASRRVVFLGDSALGKNILAEAGDSEAKAHRPVAWARELSLGAVALFDLSLDGMLPRDMLRIIQELDALDPRGRVEVVIELSPRFLSRAYANSDNANSRPYFIEASKLEAFAAPARLVRHRFGLQGWRQSLAALRQPEEALLGAPSHQPDLSEQLRLSGHFMDPAESSVQVEALQEIAALLRASGRSAQFYQTPINRSRFVGWDQSQLARSQQRLRLALEGQDESLERSTAMRFHNFDDGLFSADDFLDHVHLTALGNRVLARRLLNALEIPASTSQGAGATQGRNRDVELAGLGLESQVVAARWLAADRVLLDFADDQCELLALSDLSRQALTLKPSDAAVFPTRNQALAWRRSAEAASWQLHHFDFDAGVTEKIIAPASGSWAWAEAADIRFDASDDYLVVLHDDSITSLNWRTGTKVASAQLPEDFVGMTPLLGRDQLFLYDRPMTGVQTLHAISFAEVAAGNFAAFRVLAQTTMEPESIIDPAAFRTLRGLQQPLMKLPILPFSKFTRIWSQGGDLFFDAAAPNDRGQSCLWRMNLATGIVYAILEPERDGFILSAEGRLAHDRLLGFDDFSGWSIWQREDTMRLVQSGDLHRMDWAYGAPPAQALNTVVANGPTLAARQPNEWRLGLFGSSLVGASYPDDQPGLNRLRNSLSLGTELSAVLDERYGRDDFQVEALDFSQAQSDLLRSYVTLFSLDPFEIHCAVIAIDGGSIWNPDEPQNPEARQLAARYDALVRDEMGQPKLSYNAGFRPRAVLAAPNPEQGSNPQQSLEKLVHEMVWLAEQRGIHLVFLDLSTMEAKLGRNPLLGTLRLAIQASGTTIIDAQSILQHRQLQPLDFAYQNDRHLRPPALRILADEFSHYLEGLVCRDRSAMAAIEARKSARRAQPNSHNFRPPGRALFDAWQVAAYGIKAENTLSESQPTGSRIVADIGQSEQKPPRWRQALAVLGLRSAQLQPNQDVRIELVQFKSYDEYGRGRGEAAEVIAVFSIAAANFEAALAELTTAIERDQEPTWLQQP